MYSPKIREELVRKLYQLKQQTNKPMTNLVNEAVIEYLDKITRLRPDQSGLRRAREE